LYVTKDKGVQNGRNDSTWSTEWCD
jgi:hypothetical protein